MKKLTCIQDEPICALNFIAYSLLDTNDLPAREAENLGNLLLVLADYLRLREAED